MRERKDESYFWLPRVFIPGIEAGARVGLPSEEAHHLRVRRVGVGGVFLATDGMGREGLCRLVSLSPVTAEVERLYMPEEREVDNFPVIAFALVKDPTIEWAIRGAVESGARVFLPVVTERSLQKVSSSKLKRWQKVAVEAMKQCGGVMLPKIMEPAGLNELQGKRGAFLLPGATSMLYKGCDPAIELLMVGPEGGFTPDEEETMRGWGWTCYWLGPRILRTGTAIVVASALVAQGRWSERG